MDWFLLASLSAILLGFNSIVQKKVLIKEYASAFLSAAQILMFLMAVPLLFTAKVYFPDLGIFVLITIKCLFYVLFITFTMLALRKMEVSEFAPLTNFSPIFLLIMSFFLLGERLTSIKLIGVILIVLGGYFLELRDGWASPFKKLKNNKHLQFLFLGLFSASVSALLDKYILRVINVETFIFHQRLITAVFLILVSIIFYDGIKDIARVYKRSFAWVFLASFFYAAGDYVYSMAVAIPAAMISLIIPIKRMGNLIPTISGGVFFKEKNITIKTVSCLVMILGVYLIII